MDKEALSAIPRPALTDENKEFMLLVPGMEYLATADRQEVIFEKKMQEYEREPEKGHRKAG